MEQSLEIKLEKRIDSLIEELRPEDDSMFTYSQLMPVFEKSLKEYSKQVYGELNQEFINEELAGLQDNINPTVRDLTDGTDEIIGSFAEIELAKIIYRNGVPNTPKRKEFRPELDDGREAVFQAKVYLFSGDDLGQINKIHDELGKYIHRYSKEKMSQSSGCVLILLMFISLMSVVGLIIV